MAKFHKNTPGNGLNLKLVFTDKDGKALSNEKIDQISAGILNHTLDFPVFYGPNVNSYKRWFEDEIKESWNKIGNNSNIQGVNVIEEDKLKKIHFILPGADSNPYLVLFAAIESAKEGLKEKITSKKAESNLEGKRLPINLNQANKLFNDSKFAKQILGNDYHYHYNAFYTFEYREYLNQVSLWESKRYLYSV